MIAITSMERIPDDCLKYWVSFGIDGSVIKKLVWVHPAEKQDAAALTWKVFKALREADRDVAYLRHGKDFRQHCRITSPFFGPISDDELAGLELSLLKQELGNLNGS